MGVRNVATGGGEEAGEEGKVKERGKGEGVGGEGYQLRDGL